MFIVLPWIALAVGASALALSSVLYVRLQRIPHNRKIANEFAGVIGQLELQESRCSALTRDFRQLESEVEDMLERATKKIQRANATKTNAVRKERVAAEAPNGPVDWDAEALALENALRDGRIPWR